MYSSSNKHLNEDGGPWYKQFWAWFVFSPLIIVIIACSVFVTIAFKGKEDVVVDDYYKVGKMINQEFEPSQRAKDLGLMADLYVEPRAEEDGFGFVGIDIEPTEWLAQESLVLHLSHPAEADKDHFITLMQQDELTWRAKLKSNLTGRWYLRLSSLDDEGLEEWRLQGEIQLPDSRLTQLR